MSHDGGADPDGRPRAPKRLQRSAFRSFGVVAQLLEGAAHDTEVDSADHLRMLVGCLQQGAPAQLDDAGAGIGTRGEPELLKQGDHLAAGRHGVGRAGSEPGPVPSLGTAVGPSPGRGHGLGRGGSPDQLSTPHPARLDGVGAGLPAGPGDLRGQRGGQTGILPGTGLGADLGRGAVEPGGTPAALAGARVRTASRSSTRPSRCSRIVLGC